MLFIYIFIVFVFGFSEASQPWDTGRKSKYFQIDDCPTPKLVNGKYKVRPRSKLVRFACFSGYDLVGNKYAICRDGVWDVTHPVCVKSGCPSVDEFPNGLTITSRNGAWVMFFCVPEYKLVGSSALYCDGSRWNASIPQCVDSNTPPALKCDFEDTNICGWMQDALHDFDWKRLNKGTPSSMLFTGPSFDHTYGRNGSGYYMYIESTGRLRNETARLLSPIYDRNYTEDGCFSFYYHMFGEGTGGLKVYQKPDSVILSRRVKQRYVIFEKWGSQGDKWYNALVPLMSLDEDFQLVVEGIRGASFTSDIAIDDVELLQGDACYQHLTRTTYSSMETCVDRCNTTLTLLTRDTCMCQLDCVDKGNCCPDYFDVCLFDDKTETTLEELSHHTQKLIATTLQVSRVTTPREITTTPRPKPKPSPTTLKTTPPQTTTPKTTSLKTTTRKTTQPNKKTTPVVFEPTPIEDGTQIFVRHTKVTPKITLKTTSVVKTSTAIPKVNDNRKILAIEKAKKQKEIAIEEAGQQHISKIVSVQPQNESSIKTGYIVLVSLFLCCCVVLLFFAARTSRGREIIAKIQGRTRDDQEVRFLTANVDTED